MTSSNETPGDTTSGGIATSSGTPFGLGAVTRKVIWRDEPLPLEERDSRRGRCVTSSYQCVTNHMTN